MKLTEVIVKRPVAAIMIILAIVVFGAMSVLGMDQELTPEMEVPMMFVSTSYSGASPEDMDALVTTPIEGAVGTMSGLDTITSNSGEGYSSVMMQFEYGTDMDTAYIDLKELLDRVRLPDDASSPRIMQMSMNAGSSLELSVSGSRQNLFYYVDEELRKEFEKLSAVSEVSIYGGQSEYIRVELSEELMKQYGLTMSAVAGAVSTAEFNQPSGDVDFGSQALSLTSSVSVKSVEDLNNLPITLGNGGVIRLADVANVYEAVEDNSYISRYNGQETIDISITKRQSSSEVAVSKQVRRVVDEINAQHDDIEIEIMYDTSETIQDSINSVAQTLLLAVAISMGILFLFLGDIRASLIVGSSMPVSLLVSFIFMSWMGFTLNIITMSAMVLGVGMMVDNSIVVIDSCFKNMGQERSFIQAAIDGTKFVFLSVAASTATTVVVFLPLATIDGMAGQLFMPLGYTIAFALIASLFSAVTLVPLFFTRFQPREKHDIPVARLLKRVEYRYGNLLRRILKRKKTVLAVSAVFIAISLVMATQLDKELMSSGDEGRISISVETRPGVKTEVVNQLVLQLEEMVAEHDDVDTYSASASSGSGYINVYLKDNRRMDTTDVVDQWREATKNMVDCTVSISSQYSMSGSMGGGEVYVSLVGTDYDSLKEASEQVADIMRDNANIISVSSTLESGNPQAEIVVDAMTAAHYGLSPAQVASGVSNALGGINAATITHDGQDYSVKVVYPEGKYESISDVENLLISTASGGSVAVSQVAHIEFTNSPQSIRKNDGQYQVNITGTPVTGQQFVAESEINQAVSMLRFPDSVSQGRSTMQRSMDDVFSSLFSAIATAVLLVFMVMAIQFESVKHSIMVMVCIPFSMIGSFFFLFITGTTLNMASILGFLVLVGTVVNNGILFVDTTNEYRKSMSLETALVQTGRRRLRPILMTTLTTVLSMIPLAIGLGSGAEMMQGLGLVVIGGLAASTLLTLLLLPTFYLIIDGNPERKARRAERRRARHEKRHPVTE